MSNPNFYLSIASDATPQFIGGLLGIDVASAEPTGVRGVMKVSSQIGWIRVYYRDSQFFSTDPYNEKWNFQLRFDSSYKWNEIREVLVFKLFEWLEEEYPGIYLGSLDTGPVVFYSKNRKLIVNKNLQSHGIRLLCVPPEHILEDLPPI